MKIGELSKFLRGLLSYLVDIEKNEGRYLREGERELEKTESLCCVL